MAPKLTDHNDSNREEDVQRTELVQVRCSRLLANRMQCQRPAIFRKPEDTQCRDAVCIIHWSLEGKPKEYNVEIN